MMYAFNIIMPYIIHCNNIFGVMITRISTRGENSLSIVDKSDSKAYIPFYH